MDLVALLPVGLPSPEIEPAFPALAGRFLLTVPPGKSYLAFFSASSYSFFSRARNFYLLVICFFIL